MSFGSFQASSSDPTDSSRKKLMLGVALGLMLLAVILLFWRLRGEQPDVHPPAVALPIADGYTMICGSCRTSFDLKRDQFDSWPKDDTGGYKCPKCGSSRTTPDNSKVTPMTDVPGGG
jgi:hypothetical protein